MLKSLTIQRMKKRRKTAEEKSSSLGHRNIYRGKKLVLGSRRICRINTGRGIGFRILTEFRLVQKQEKNCLHDHNTFDLITFKKYIILKLYKQLDKVIRESC